MRAILLAAILTSALPGTVAGQTLAQQWAWCRADDPEHLIGGCSAVIRAGREKPDISRGPSRNRGRAWSDRGQLTAPSRILTARSGSTRNTRTPSTIAGWRMWAKAIPRVRSMISTRRSDSMRTTPSRSSTAASPFKIWVGRPRRPRHSPRRNRLGRGSSHPGIDVPSV